MKRRDSMLLLSMAIGSITSAQCNIDFNYSAHWDTLTFANLSAVPNAHYYWNFGNGSTTYETNPGHVFPRSRKSSGPAIK